jgi:hypothetical protein
MIVEASTWSGKDSLAVLGAGNCNDIDLTALTSTCFNVYLFDIDEEGLTQGVARQKLGQATTRVHGHLLDVTGAMDLVAGWGAAGAWVLTDEIAARTAFAIEYFRIGSVFPDDFPQTCAVVVSSCILSQIIVATEMSAADDAKSRKAAIPVMIFQRDHHLRHMVDMLKNPGAPVYCSRTSCRL